VSYAGGRPRKLRKPVDEWVDDWHDRRGTGMKPSMFPKRDAAIVKAYKAGEVARVIAERYGLTTGAIYHIVEADRRRREAKKDQ
jgi:hypothetical protein